MNTDPTWILLLNIVLRGIERLIIAGGGLLLVYLGYQLFIKGVSGAASLSLQRDKLRFQLLNAAPGTLFALFGCALMGTAIIRGVWYSYRIPDDADSTSARAVILEGDNNDSMTGTCAPA